MSILNIETQGIRSFKNMTTINLATPDMEKEGSGLNIFVGPNNSGKSSLIETIYLANTESQMIPNEARNIQSKDGVYIKILLTNGDTKILSSLKESPAFVTTKYVDKNNKEIYENKTFAYILSSKRNIGINFSSSSETWESFIFNHGGNDYRKENLSNNIGGRFKNIIESSKRLFDYELKKILGYLPEWTLDSNNSNELYISFRDGQITHTNSGSGDGFINLFVILTSIYDAPVDSTIVIDEPEVALHPDVQKRLMERLVFHSKTKQIIISTHSPYFIDLNLLQYGAKLFRFNKDNESTNIHTIKSETIPNIGKLLNTIEQPYLQDIKSKEIFFMDKLILVEGVDDVYGYSSLFKKYNYCSSGNFYGWGVGGAERIKILLEILDDLNYSKVVVILDNDKSQLQQELTNQYPHYKILSIPAKDIRNKEAPNIKNIEKLIASIKKEASTESSNILDLFYKSYIAQNKVDGIIIDRKQMTINKIYEDDIEEMIQTIKEYFNDTFDTERDEDVYAKLLQDSMKSIANKILDKYIQDYPEKTSHYLQNKYLTKKFVNVDFEKLNSNISNNLYSFEFIQNAQTQNQKFVEVHITIEVNVESKEVTNISYNETFNNLNN